MNRRRRRRSAGSSPSRRSQPSASHPPGPGSSTRSVPACSTADQTVGHDPPNPRAIDAMVPSIASIRSVAHATARCVSTRRGPASSHASVQVFVGQSGSGHDQIRRHTRPRRPGHPTVVAQADPAAVFRLRSHASTPCSPSPSRSTRPRSSTRARRRRRRAL